MSKYIPSQIDQIEAAAAGLASACDAFQQTCDETIALIEDIDRKEAERFKEFQRLSADTSSMIDEILRAS